jgi:hypothetical protein
MISIATGALLYAFVEKPFRFTADKTPFQRSRSLAVTAMLFAVCAIGGAHYWALGGFPGRMAPEFRKYASMQREWDRRLKAVRLDVCNFTEDKPLQSYDSKECATPPGDRRAYMIIGDSYAADAYLFLPRAYPDIYFGQLSLPGCPLNAPSKLKFGPARGWCAKFYKRAFRIARENGFDGVVFTSNWSAERNDIIDALIRWSERNDLDAVFLSARPRFKQRIPVIVTSSMNQAQAERRAAAALPPTSKKLAAAMDAKYGSQVKVVNMYKAMCGDDRCSVFDDQGRILYMDDSHVSVDGAKWLALRFRQTYPDLFK